MKPAHGVIAISPSDEPAESAIDALTPSRTERTVTPDLPVVRGVTDVVAVAPRGVRLPVWIGAERRRSRSGVAQSAAYPDSRSVSSSANSSSISGRSNVERPL